MIRPRYIKHPYFVIDFVDIELFNIDLLRTYLACIDLSDNIDPSVVENKESDFLFKPLLTMKIIILMKQNYLLLLTFVVR